MKTFKGPRIANTIKAPPGFKPTRLLKQNSKDKGKT